MDDSDKKSKDIICNHKLKLEEYDEDGNLIDCIELPQREKDQLKNKQSIKGRKTEKELYF